MIKNAFINQNLTGIFKEFYICDNVDIVDVIVTWEYAYLTNMSCLY